MPRGKAAARVARTADDLQAWLDQRPGADPAPAGSEAARRTGAGRDLPPAATSGSPTGGEPAQPVPALTSAPAGSFQRQLEPLDPLTPPPAPLRLPHPDWLHHRLTVTGPTATLQRFRAAAAGAGVVPWHLDLDRMEEDYFHRLVAPQAPQGRTVSVAGARVLAAQLRAAVTRRHERAIARVGRSLACPFDLHALVPVPAAVLRLGPDDPLADVWLWQHWGTMQALRHVTDVSPARDVAAARGTPNQAVWRVAFWAADWSPWRALASVVARWPGLRFDLQPNYELA